MNKFTKLHKNFGYPQFFFFQFLSKNMKLREFFGYPHIFFDFLSMEIFLINFGYPQILFFDFFVKNSEIAMIFWLPQKSFSQNKLMLFGDSLDDSLDGT